jgi:hypothetical protein
MAAGVFSDGCISEGSDAPEAQRTQPGGRVPPNTELSRCAAQREEALKSMITLCKRDGRSFPKSLKRLMP